VDRCFSLTTVYSIGSYNFIWWRPCSRFNAIVRRRKSSDKVVQQLERHCKREHSGIFFADVRQRSRFRLHPVYVDYLWRIEEIILGKVSFCSVFTRHRSQPTVELDRSQLHSTLAISTSVIRQSVLVHETWNCWVTFCDPATHAVTRESSDPETQLTRWPCSIMNSKCRLM